MLGLGERARPENPHIRLEISLACHEFTIAHRIRLCLLSVTEDVELNHGLVFSRDACTDRRR